MYYNDGSNPSPAVNKEKLMSKLFNFNEVNWKFFNLIGCSACFGTEQPSVPVEVDKAQLELLGIDTEYFN
jgi:hypothetical protein